MPRWEGKLALGIPDDCHLSCVFGGSELQPPTWSKAFPISRIEEESIPEPVPWSGPSGPAATGELNSSSSLFFVFVMSQQFWRSVWRIVSFCLYSEDFRSCIFREQVRCGQKTSLHLTHKQTKLFNL